MGDKRKIISVDEDKCTGCGECIPNCPEGALQVIDGKARLVSDLFCDGLGACVGHCPEGAMTVEEREAEPYDEKKVMANIVKHGANTIAAHLKHLKDHGADDYHREAVEFLKERGIEVPEEEGPPPLPCGCPGTHVMDFRAGPQADGQAENEPAVAASRPSRLRQWPVQIKLVPPTAPYLRGADLLVAADCVPFAFAGFHEEFLKGKTLLVGCPKLDDADFYLERFTAIFKANDVRSVTVAHMEVPCCSGMVEIVKAAIAKSGRVASGSSAEATRRGKVVPFAEVTVSVRGEVLTGAEAG